MSDEEKKEESQEEAPETETEETPSEAELLLEDGEDEESEEQASDDLDAMLANFDKSVETVQGVGDQTRHDDEEDEFEEEEEDEHRPKTLEEKLEERLDQEKYELFTETEDDEEALFYIKDLLGLEDHDEDDDEEDKPTIVSRLKELVGDQASSLRDWLLSSRFFKKEPWLAFIKFKWILKIHIPRDTHELSVLFKSLLTKLLTYKLRIQKLVQDIKKMVPVVRDQLESFYHLHMRNILISFRYLMKAIANNCFYYTLYVPYDKFLITTYKYRLMRTGPKVAIFVICSFFIVICTIGAQLVIKHTGLFPEAAPIVYEIIEEEDYLQSDETQISQLAAVQKIFRRKKLRFIAPGKPPPPEHTHIFHKMVVNISSRSGENALLAVDMIVELANPILLEKTKKRSVEFKHYLIQKLEHRYFEDIEHPIGKENLKKEVITLLNTKFDKDKAVKRVFFNNFIVY